MIRTLLWGVTIICVLMLGGPSVWAKKRTGDDRGGENAKALLTSKLRAAFGERALVDKIRFGSLSPREASTFDVALPRRGCYQFAVTAQSSVTDLSLAIFDGQQEVGRDRLSGRKPAVEWCIEAPKTATVELFMFGGSGTFALAVFSESHDLIPIGIHKIGGDGNDFIGNRIRQLYAQFARKRIPVSPLLKGELPKGESARFDIMLDKGCLTAIGVGGPSVEELEISLLSATGESVGGGEVSGKFSVFDVPNCPIPKGAYRIVVRMVEGSGVFGVQLYAK